MRLYIILGVAEEKLVRSYKFSWCKSRLSEKNITKDWFATRNIRDDEAFAHANKSWFTIFIGFVQPSVIEFRCNLCFFSSKDIKFQSDIIITMVDYEDFILVFFKKIFSPCQMSLILTLCKIQSPIVHISLYLWNGLIKTML